MMCFLAQNNIVSGIFASNLLRLKNHQLFRELLISQQGFLARNGTIPMGMGGMVDCNGYQMGFIRSNEMFVLEPH